jgi:hypothetical protein
LRPTAPDVHPWPLKGTEKSEGIRRKEDRCDFILEIADRRQQRGHSAALDSFRFAVYQGRMGRLKMRPPRPKRQRKAATPAKPRGLRIQLKGTRTLAELQDMLRQAIERIDELAITHASGINLYITPVDKNGSPVTPVSNGHTVSSVTIEAPYKSAADEYGL